MSNGKDKKKKKKKKIDVIHAPKNVGDTVRTKSGFRMIRIAQLSNEKKKKKKKKGK